MRFRWTNFPVPEAHVVGLLIGGLIQVLIPSRLYGAGWIGHALGWPISILGLWIACWCLPLRTSISWMYVARNGTSPRRSASDICATKVTCDVTSEPRR